MRYRIRQTQCPAMPWAVMDMEAGGIVKCYCVPYTDVVIVAHALNFAADRDYSWPCAEELVLK